MAALQASTLDTPDGPFTIVANDSAVVASGWARTAGELLHEIRLAWPGGIDDQASDPQSMIGQAVAAVAAYYAGDADAVGRLPVHQVVGEFHGRARTALRATDPGEQLSYTELAARAGNVKAARAAAAACARNHTALFVPCHRVIRADGSLGGFLYGLPIKRSLLDREQAHLRSSRA